MLLPYAAALLLAEWAVAAPQLVLPDATQKSPTASIRNGVVVGTATSLPSASAAVNKFLGIPFAQSPPERFSPPKAALNFKGTYNATQFRPACIQQFKDPPASQQFSKGLFNSPPPIGGESEDCLYVNVFAPSTPAPKGGRTVMFWIYGGGYAFGASSLPGYDGSAFAAYHDVVLVTHNYRTNVFGFSGSPQIAKGKRNPGYLDQRMALSWVQDNIAAFGGDPAKVTIFGESAGSWSVDNLIVTYPENPPFRAAIMESGQLTYRANPVPGNSTPSWETMISMLNCTTGDALKCARAAPASKIKQVIEEGMLDFNPEVDNITRPYSNAVRRESGQFAKVPVLLGSNANEGRVFEYGQTNLTEFLHSSLDLTAPQLIPKVAKAYPVGNISSRIAGGNTEPDRISELATLLGFQCGMSLLANLTAHLDVPVWQYYYNSTFPNIYPLDGALGVFHSSEIYLVFGTYPGGPVLPVYKEAQGLLPLNVSATKQEAALSKYMNGVWADFAKDPHAGPTWSQTKGFKQGDMAILGGHKSNYATVVAGHKLRSPCQLLLPAFTTLTGPAYGLPNYKAPASA